MSVAPAILVAMRHTGCRSASRRDELALDAAVALAGATVVALVDHPETALAARARGAGRVVLADGADPGHAIATLRARESFDAVLIGDSVAALPDLPRLSEIRALALAADGLRLIRETGTRRETFRATVPIAAMIDNPFAEPALLSLWAIADAREFVMETLDGLPPAAPPEPRRPARVTRDCRFFDSADTFADAVLAAASPQPGATRDPLPDGVERIASESIVRRRPPLDRASVVVAGGRALADADSFDRTVGRLADSLGAAVAASGGATAHGYANAELLVGSSGAQIAPELYLALGISGVDPHLGGIVDSKIIAAVDRNPHAPIFGCADLGFVGDLFEAVDALRRRQS